MRCRSSPLSGRHPESKKGRPEERPLCISAVDIGPDALLEELRAEQGSLKRLRVHSARELPR
jgi:hypothetical protein